MRFSVLTKEEWEGTVLASSPSDFQVVDETDHQHCLSFTRVTFDPEQPSICIFIPVTQLCILEDPVKAGS